jgi:hypothetical protein
MASNVWMLLDIVTAYLWPILTLTSCRIKFKTYFITAFELQNKLSMNKVKHAKKNF